MNHGQRIKYLIKHIGQCGDYCKPKGFFKMVLEGSSYREACRFLKCPIRKYMDRKGLTSCTMKEAHAAAVIINERKQKLKEILK